MCSDTIGPQASAVACGLPALWVSAVRQLLSVSADLACTVWCRQGNTEAVQGSDELVPEVRLLCPLLRFVVPFHELARNGITNQGSRHRSLSINEDLLKFHVNQNYQVYRSTACALLDTKCPVLSCQPISYASVTSAL